jgi:hypothetical protein
MVNCELPSCFWLQRASCLLACCNIQFLTMVMGHCLHLGVRLAVPSWIGGATEMKRVRQAVPLRPGRQSRWHLSKVKCYATLATAVESERSSSWRDPSLVPQSTT